MGGAGARTDAITANRDVRCATHDGSRVDREVRRFNGSGLAMVTKAQIDRIATRIEALAPKSDRIVCVRCDQDETTEHT